MSVRAVTCIVLFFVLLALFWALQPPLAAYAAVRALGSPRLDAHALEQQLRRAGHAARPALRHGLASDNLRRRVFCARLLALSGDGEGDLCLLRMLRQRGSDAQDSAAVPLSGDSAAAMAETFILSVWMERDAPPAPLRARALASSSASELTSLLEQYHAWSAGYVALARMSQNNGEAAGARHYAMLALTAEPENFEAMVLLAQACLRLDLPGQAMLCLEHAVAVNPRLRPALAGEIHEALQKLDRERARNRKEQRQHEPIASLATHIRPAARATPAG